MLSCSSFGRGVAENRVLFSFIKQHHVGRHGCCEAYGKALHGGQGIGTRLPFIGENFGELFVGLPEEKQQQIEDLLVARLESGELLDTYSNSQQEGRKILRKR